jgi:hypothetical protein
MLMTASIEVLPGETGLNQHNDSGCRTHYHRVLRRKPENKPIRFPTSLPYTSSCLKAAAAKQRPGTSEK